MCKKLILGYKILYTLKEAQNEETKLGTEQREAGHRPRRQTNTGRKQKFQ